jgi:enoyl-CoA hydratase
MSEFVSYQVDDGVATLSLNNGKVNAISLPVLEAFNKALSRAADDRAVVIITGQPGMFSAGYDLEVFKTGPQNAANLVSAGSLFSRRMLAHPYPIIVACTGLAAGEGAFILLSSDYRIGADGPFQISVPVVKLGMTMHRVGLALCRARLTPSVFNRAVNNAEVFDPPSALAAGFLDRVVPAERLMETAKAVAGDLAKLDMVAHRQTKLLARKALLEELDHAIKTDRGEILLRTEIW